MVAVVTLWWIADVRVLQVNTRVCWKCRTSNAEQWCGAVCLSGTRGSAQRPLHAVCCCVTDSLIHSAKYSKYYGCGSSRCIFSSQGQQVRQLTVAMQQLGTWKCTSCAVTQNNLLNGVFVKPKECTLSTMKQEHDVIRLCSACLYYTMFIMFQLNMQWRVVLLSQPSVGHQVSMWSAALFIVFTDYLLRCSLASTVSSPNNVRLIQNLSLKHLEMDHPSFTSFFNRSKEVFVNFVRYCTASISINNC